MKIPNCTEHGLKLLGSFPSLQGRFSFPLVLWVAQSFNLAMPKMGTGTLHRACRRVHSVLTQFIYQWSVMRFALFRHVKKLLTHRVIVTVHPRKVRAVLQAYRFANVQSCECMLWICTLYTIVFSTRDVFFILRSVRCCLGTPTVIAHSTLSRHIASDGDHPP